MRLTIKLCDFCGKRTDELVGTLHLTHVVKRRNTSGSFYEAPTTIWSKKICKTCTGKFSALETIGDKLHEEVMLKIDEHYLTRKRLLEVNLKKEIVGKFEVVE